MAHRSETHNWLPDEQGLMEMACLCGSKFQSVPKAWVGRYGWTCSIKCPDRAQRKEP